MLIVGGAVDSELWCDTAPPGIPGEQNVVELALPPSVNDNELTGGMDNGQTDAQFAVLQSPNKDGPMDGMDNGRHLGSLQDQQLLNPRVARHRWMMDKMDNGRHAKIPLTTARNGQRTSRYH
jgi:hypothetical protein